MAIFFESIIVSIRTYLASALTKGADASVDQDHAGEFRIIRSECDYGDLGGAENQMG